MGGEHVLRGKWGEEQAALFLMRHGYTIITKNYRTRFGEIDLIASCLEKRFGYTLCFIEVKTRGSHTGSAERAVGKKKKEHMYAAAMAYCVSCKIHIDSVPIRFEQISIYIKRREKRAEIRHYLLPHG